MNIEELIKILNDEFGDVTKDFTTYDLIDYVTCLEKVKSDFEEEYDLWFMWKDVYKVNDEVYLEYTYPRTPGDRTPWELGYKDNGLGDIKIVNRREVISYIYEVN